MSVKCEMETTGSGLRELTRSDLERMVNSIRADVVAAFSDAKPVPISYLGQEIWVLPVDTKRFIRVMSRHINLN